MRARCSSILLACFAIQRHRIEPLLDQVEPLLKATLHAIETMVERTEKRCSDAVEYAAFRRSLRCELRRLGDRDIHYARASRTPPRGRGRDVGLRVVDRGVERGGDIGVCEQTARRMRKLRGAPSALE